MHFDFSDYRTFHIIAAYAVAGIFMAGLALVSLRDYFRAKRGKS